MKELSIEEKAKRYDEALERAKGVIEQNPLMEYLKKGIEYILPELKESEDERIRKALIILLQHFCKGYRVPGLDFPVSFKDMLAWLEKQSEQKPAKWSLEDERVIAIINNALTESNTPPDDYDKVYDWLESIKQRIGG